MLTWLLLLPSCCHLKARCWGGKVAEIKRLVNHRDESENLSLTRLQSKQQHWWLKFNGSKGFDRKLCRFIVVSEWKSVSIHPLSAPLILSFSSSYVIKPLKLIIQSCLHSFWLERVWVFVWCASNGSEGNVSSSRVLMNRTKENSEHLWNLTVDYCSVLAFFFLLLSFFPMTMLIKPMIWQKFNDNSKYLRKTRLSLGVSLLRTLELSWS